MIELFGHYLSVGNLAEGIENENVILFVLKSLGMLAIVLLEYSVSI